MEKQVPQLDVIKTKKKNDTYYKKGLRQLVGGSIGYD